MHCYKTIKTCKNCFYRFNMINFIKPNLIIKFMLSSVYRQLIELMIVDCSIMRASLSNFTINCSNVFLANLVIPEVIPKN